MVGAVLMIVAFTFMGPLPFFNIKKTIPIVVGSLVCHGIGLGAEVVSGFADAHKQAIESGFPDTVDTYGLISGLWTSVFALGAFIGPTIAGILFDAVGFPWAALFVVINQVIVIVSLSAFFLGGNCRRDTQVKDDDEDDQLIQTEHNGHSYGTIDEESVEAARAAARSRRRATRRSRKYSEVLSVGGNSMSVARSMSMAYPQFMGPGVANSYRNPPPSLAYGAIGGSVADMENVQEIVD